MALHFYTHKKSLQLKLLIFHPAFAKASYFPNGLAAQVGWHGQ
jgi:hypothetical protein